jgi:nucleotide-binding universal stress UspA family protein
MTHIMSPILIQNVLLATDFSEASVAAVGHAAAVARSYQGTVDIVHVVVPEVYWWAPPESLPSIEEGIRIWAEQKMKNVLASEQLGDVPHEGIIKHGEIWDVLQSVVAQRRSDLIVTGTRGRRGLRKLVMGSVAEEILRLSLVPVLNVQPDAGLSGITALRNVLYPTDFSVDSIRALAYALSFSEKFQACLTLLHVVRGALDNPERERLQVFFIYQLQELVQQQATSPGRQQFRVEFGDPTSGILRCADSTNADLIVMGVRGTGAMVRASTHFGSTAYRVISEARVPVFSVRGIREDLST